MSKKIARLAERLLTKWYNEGEKSVRYFLLLLNRHLPDVFTEIRTDNGNITGYDQIENKIVNFYISLYQTYNKSNIDLIQDESFYDLVDRLSQEEEEEVVQPIMNAELERTLHTCKDSAPGPDGIPYSFLRLLFWPIIGDAIVDAWNHSLETGTLCPSHKQSYLKLIPKAGKVLKLLTNWKPITLSNCDHKIIT